MNIDAEVAKVNIVIGLIPYMLHVIVICSAICAAKDFITTSVSPAMQALDAKRARPRHHSA
jgi:saccharopine dehydrogenase (NADP+, L-glutamate forming)